MSRLVSFAAVSIACMHAYIHINVKNEDNNSWPSKYRNHHGKLEFNGIDFPVKVTDIDRFERQNIDISMTIFGWNGGLYQIRISDESRTYNVDLLLLVSYNTQHYVSIKKLGRLLAKNSKLEGHKYTCRRCLHVFSKQDLLDDHLKDCK